MAYKKLWVVRYLSQDDWGLFGHGVTVHNTRKEAEEDYRERTPGKCQVATLGRMEADGTETELKCKWG